MCKNILYRFENTFHVNSGHKYGQKKTIIGQKILNIGTNLDLSTKTKMI